MAQESSLETQKIKRNIKRNTTDTRDIYENTEGYQQVLAADVVNMTKIG